MNSAFTNILNWIDDSGIQQVKSDLIHFDVIIMQVLMELLLCMRSMIMNHSIKLENGSKKLTSNIINFLFLIDLI
jgi:hypothetical protein